MPRIPVLSDLIDLRKIGRVVGAEDEETEISGRRRILVPCGTELPGVPEFKLQETSCLILKRNELNFGAAVPL